MSSHKKIFALFGTLINASVLAAGASPSLYINENIGFNVKGYNYTQASFPCDVDKTIVADLVSRGASHQMTLRPTASLGELHNGTVPVLAMDIEQLVLTDSVQYGPKSTHPLPKIQLVAALIKGDQVATQQHSCAILSLSEFTSSSDILDMGTVTTVCGALKKCVGDLNNDILTWVQSRIGNK